MDARTKTALGRAGGILVVVLVVLSVKVIVSSRAELDRARRAETAGELEVAVTHYRRAARWHLPVQPWADEALDALMAIGEAAEERGDAVLALASYRSAHAAIMSTRHLWVPDRERLHRADERIAHLMATGEVPPVDARRSEAEREALYLEMLEEDRDPALGWSLLALLGFLLWLAGAYGVFTRALDEDDRFVQAELRKWGTLFVLGFGFFALGLALA